MVDDLTSATEAWIASDPDPQTRAELRRLLGAANPGDLADRMAGTLEFGTAGLRGKVEAGSNRMNRAVVIRTTAGLAAYYYGRGGDGPVVVGHDARLSSRRFMEDTVEVLAQAGIPVCYFAEPVPTPLVAFAALDAGARAAVVITASHNPPADNGYKVYDHNGAQIVSPVDEQISAAIDRVGAAIDVPMATGAWHAPLVQGAPGDTFDRYLAAVEATRWRTEATSPLRIVYTPMHGVGGRYVVDALAAAGHREVFPVAEQFTPDGHFPTVAFPNPEEPGALDLAFRDAAAHGADLVIANDPDADRLAVAVPEGDSWRALTGNQIGVLLADAILSHTAEPHPLVINSIVSSPMLESVAADHGAKFATTLTGFKWIWNAALDLEASAAGRFVFGYEEALGYNVLREVRDKDGISAAVLFADLVADAQAEGRSVLDLLDALYQRHGLWVSTQKSIVRPGIEGAAEIAAAIDRLAAAPPTEIGGVPVEDVVDYRHGAEDRPRYLGATPLVALGLGAAGRVLVRPSGTEPKIKIYVDLRSDLDGASATEREPGMLAEAGRLAEAAAAAMGF